MADVPKNGLVLVGAVIAIVGILAIAVPYFTTQQTTEVAKIGGLHIDAQEQTTHAVPQFLGPALLALGLIIVGAGVVSRR